MAVEVLQMSDDLTLGRLFPSCCKLSSEYSRRAKKNLNGIPVYGASRQQGGKRCFKCE